MVDVVYFVWVQSKEDSTVYALLLFNFQS